MKPHLGAASLLVRDYDEAIAWYTRVLGFALAEDTPLGGGKRWVVIAPPGSTETRLLLAQAMKPEEIAAIGRQGAGRVWLFLHTDNFVRDHRAFTVHHPRRATGDESLRHGPSNLGKSCAPRSSKTARPPEREYSRQFCGDTRTTPHKTRGLISGG